MRKRSNIIIYISAGLVILAFICGTFFDSLLGEQLTNIFTIATAVIGAVGIYIQFKSDKEVNQASFMSDFSYHFYDQEGNVDILSKLEKYRKGEKDVFKKSDYDNIVNYLLWCESLASLINRGIMSMSLADDLFDYRFFIIVNNEYVQKNELIPERSLYEILYTAHKKWSDFRRKRGRAMIMDETSLDKTEHYYEILNNFKKHK